MEYVKISGEFPELSGCTLTIGKFDGLHRGHQKLVEAVLRQKSPGRKAVLFAFVTSGRTILGLEERRRLLERMGIDLLIECPLDGRIRSMEAEVFARDILAGRFHASHVAVGEDFRFGCERKGTPRKLQQYGEKYGFAAEILPCEMEGRRKVSSTYIREELQKGNMEKTASLLGRDFSVEGKIEHGRGIGHEMFFPTANLIPPREKLMPPNGVYFTVSRVDGKRFCGMTNVGYKPTVGEKFLGVETYFYGCGEDLYGKDCLVEFKKFHRPERRFASFEALKGQMQKDISQGEEYFRGWK